jgi:hypothetical protein
MTLRFPVNGPPARTANSVPHRAVHLVVFAAAVCGALACAAQSKPASDPAPDVLVLSNGDTLHGKLVNEMQGKVTFHSDPLGDISLGWDKIKELHASQRFAVLDKSVKLSGKKSAAQIPIGPLEVENQTVSVHPQSSPAPAPIPVKDVQLITDEATLNKDVFHTPGFFEGWNGAATAGASVVTATQNQYTFTGGIGLVRLVPTVSWLDPRNRTSADFTASYGKITQPAYLSGDALVPAVVTKSAIFHADAERDQYFSPRFFALGQTAFDHNYGQDLQLQQIYGGGFGWTAMKTPKQEADLKGTIQYEKQAFISGASTSNPNLVGSTFAATYVLHLKLLAFTQGVAYIPAYNDMQAYSVNETNTFSFPAYKRLSFSLGTMDSYLNDPPTSLPPTKRNSFQFTMGMTYAIKSKY